MKTLDSFVVAAFVVVNVFALVQLIGSYRWPTITRLTFCLLFGIAAVVNTKTIFDTPWVYQSYADYAIPLYSRFILGLFDAITQPMVLGIAVGQAGIAVSMLMKRHWFRAGSLSGIVFCLAMAPLGLGAAFPATVLMALAFYRLYKHEGRESIADVLDHNWVLLPMD